MGCVSSKAESGEVDEALRRELFQKFMVKKREVDNSMTSLAKALHSARATMRLLFNDSEDKTATQEENGEKSTHRKHMQLERNCFFHLENLIHHEERSAIECVCKLLNFITNAAEEHLMIKQSDKSLELERYSTESKAKVWDQASDFDIEIKKLELEIGKLKRNNKQLTKRNETLTKTETATKEENKQIKIQMEELEQQILSYETKTQDFENSLKQENQSRSDSQKQYSELQKELEKTRSQHKISYDKLFEETEALRIEKENMMKRQTEVEKDTARDKKYLQKQLDHERNEKKSLHLKISEIENLREQFESEKHEKDIKIEQVKKYEIDMQKLKSENVSMKKEIDRLRETHKELTKRISNLEEEVQNHKKINATLESDNQSCDSERRQLKRIVEQLQKNLKEKETAILKIQEMYDATKKELEHIMSKKVLQVQLYHQSRTALLSEVEGELKALLKSEMEDDRTEIVFTNCNGKYDIDQNKPLLILCIGASRLGTDAKNAIHELNLTSKMALLILHHKDVHALPNQASERVLTGHEFKPLGEIFDMAFLSSKGIYKCEMNNQNIKNVIAFLHKQCEIFK